VNRKNPRIALAGVALIGTIAAALALAGQETGPPRGTIGMAHDWSHRHVIFSNPTTVEQGLRVRQDPRFWQQYFRRNVQRALPATERLNDDSLSDEELITAREDDSLSDWFGWRWRRHRRPPPRNTLKRDWSISLGPNATVGAGNYPAKFSFNINSANCGGTAQPDFVVFNTSVNGSGTQASVVAYDNLYTGCGGAVPQTYWSYNTGGSVVTSAVLSLDGSQIAFIQTPPLLPIANLVLLKWKASTSGATSTMPDPINIVTPSQYPTCTTPCMTTLAFSGVANDTNSSPFYDYTNDTMYVGDNNGSLHKFHPVFASGTPAEVLSGWPVLLAAGLKLSSPVYDSVTGRVFVGSGSNGVSGSQLFAVTASTGIIPATSPSLGKGNGIAAGPIVDSSAGKIYVFVGTDNSPSGTCFGGGPCSGVYQFNANSTLTSPVEATVQRGSNSFTFTLYAGTFDNNYYTSSNSTGNLYVCGNTLGSGTLFQIPVAAGTMSATAAAGPQLSGTLGLASNAPCSPVTEIFNPNVGGPPGMDKIFVSTTGGGVSFCSTGCLYDMPITSWQPTTAYAIGEEITDKFLDIQVVTTAGTSGNNPPSWSSPGNPTFDGTVGWTGKSGLGAGGYGTWQAHTIYSTGSAVLDPNGNVEAELFNNATSGATQPVWPVAVAGRVSDNAASWINLGPPDNFLLSVGGGTSGMVVDNTVPIGTLAGGSQVYFSPLGMGFGTCGVGNGCALQASQAKLN
jgi:hypothetical protein